jgi:hypothetical protein
MKTLGQLLVFGGILTGIDGIGIFLASPDILGIGGAALALPIVLLIGGVLLIKRSKPGR